MTDDQLKHILLHDPPEFVQGYFLDSNQVFQRDLYYQFMTNLDGFIAGQQVPADVADQYRQLALGMQDQVRFNTMLQGVRDAVGMLYPASPLLLRNNYDLANSKATGSFILLNANLIPDSEVEVSDEEAKAYYDEHKNQYFRKASRSLRYSMLRLGPSAKDSQKVQTQFRRYTEELSKGTTAEAKDSIFGELAEDMGTRKFSGVSYTPRHEVPATLLPLLDSAKSTDIIGPVRVDNSTLYVNVMNVRDSGETWVKAQHVLVRFDGNDSTEEGQAILDSLKTVAEGIANEARSGADFAQLARDKSDDQGSAQSGGDVGWFSEKSPFVDEFKEAALPASPGQIVGPVKSQFGYHVIKVTEKSTKRYKLRAISFDINVSNATRNLLRRKAEELRSRLQDGEIFDTVAAELELQVLDAPNITSANQPVAGSWALGSFAFDADMGDISEVIKLQDDALVVAELSKVTPAGPAPFDEVKDQINARLLTMKKVDKLKGRADQISSQLKAGEEISAQAATIDSTLIVRQFTDQTMLAQFPDVGSEARLTSAVFTMKPGEISQPIKGDRGYYIVQIDSIAIADDAQYTADTEAQKQALQQQRQTVFQRWFQEEIDNASIQRYWDR